MSVDKTDTACDQRIVDGQYIRGLPGDDAFGFDQKGFLRRPQAVYHSVEKFRRALASLDERPVRDDGDVVALAHHGPLAAGVP